jgi:extradiol dioxygenase family protein
MPPFHLAFPVTDLEATRRFYADLLGCGTGRESERWIDFDFFGHQVTAHLTDRMPAVSTNSVDGKNVPASHFGAVLDWDAWHELADKLRAAGVSFLIEPYIRFEGQTGEQATMFVTDPSGNGLEFKSFKNPREMFAR